MLSNKWYFIYFTFYWLTNLWGFSRLNCVIALLWYTFCITRLSRLSSLWLNFCVTYFTSRVNKCFWRVFSFWVGHPSIFLTGWKSLLYNVLLSLCLSCTSWVHHNISIYLISWRVRTNIDLLWNSVYLWCEFLSFHTNCNMKF